MTKQSFVTTAENGRRYTLVSGQQPKEVIEFPRLSHPNINMKLCRVCDNYRNKNQFHKNKRSDDGLLSICGKCANAAAKKRKERKNQQRDQLTVGRNKVVLVRGKHLADRIRRKE